MKRDLIHLPALKSSFLSCEKDIETILRKLFIESKPYSDELKRLLIISAKDCLTNPQYQEKIDSFSIADMIKEGYIKITPKIPLKEHEQVKSYIILSFDNFIPNGTNTEFRDCIVNIDVICHMDYWDIGDFKLRPFKIIGFIDGLLDKNRLSGIGTLNFAGCNQLVLDENLAGYALIYRAVHGTDDRLES